MIKQNKKKRNLIVKIAGYCVIYFMLLFGGFSLGMIYQQQLLFVGLGQAFEGLEGTTFNVEVDFNKIFDKAEPVIKETIEKKENE